ncbi:hypothetical protein LOC67_23780 [Stieleria sp. JC731]|uniref:hypothetical protein n=1 Tax=Pirellulaceae TaxID=2691357 RepID=UPI001E2FD91C|nr:hypothetical protein [Stieleria sp. JC731]MCC9603581.1 hypothetical protein [Stieleria sp. JC731]
MAFFIAFCQDCDGDDALDGIIVAAVVPEFGSLENMDGVPVTKGAMPDKTGRKAGEDKNAIGR